MTATQIFYFVVAALALVTLIARFTSREFGWWWGLLFRPFFSIQWKTLDEEDLAAGVKPKTSKLGALIRWLLLWATPPAVFEGHFGGIFISAVLLSALLIVKVLRKRANREEPEFEPLDLLSYDERDKRDALAEVLLDDLSPKDKFKPVYRSTKDLPASAAVKVKTEDEAQAYEARLENARSLIKSVAKEDGYYEAIIRTPVGMEDATIVKRSAAIASALELHGVEPFEHQDAQGLVGLRLYYEKQKNPLAVEGGIPYPLDAVPTHKALPFGLDAFGRPVSLGLLETNQLLGGVPGGGKSGGLTCLLFGIAQLANVAVVGIDAKFGVEFSLWKTRLTSLAKNKEEATVLLQLLIVEMERRYEWLEQNGKKKVTLDLLSPDLPLIVVPIDELADLVSVGVTRDEKSADLERQTLIRRLIALGRAAGIIVITATQKPSADIVPTAIRDLIQQRVAFATTNSSMTDTILGFGMSGNGGLAHEIPTDANSKGMCYIVSESSRTPVKARAYWIPDEEVEARSEEFSINRVPLTWLEIPFEAAKAEIAQRKKEESEALLGDYAKTAEPVLVPEAEPTVPVPSNEWLLPPRAL